jgi:hypothetical protein
MRCKHYWESRATRCDPHKASMWWIPCSCCPARMLMLGLPDVDASDNVVFADSDALAEYLSVYQVMES